MTMEKVCLIDVVSCSSLAGRSHIDDMTPWQEVPWSYSHMDINFKLHSRRTSRSKRQVRELEERRQLLNRHE